MVLNNLVESLIETARERGNSPDLVTMSPDVYSRWQKQNRGVEPIQVGGVPIQIRDNYKSGTILLLGEKCAQR